MAYANLFENLARKGHNVTVISHFSQRNQIPNYRDIKIGNLTHFSPMMEGFSNLPTSTVAKIIADYLLPIFIMPIAELCGKITFESESVQEFLREKQNFDVILMEDFYSEFQWALVQHYNCPVVRFQTCMPWSWTGRRLANPGNPSYLTNIRFRPTRQMTFTDRVMNTLLYISDLFFFDFYLMKIQRRLSEKYFNVDEKTFDSRFYNESLVFVNTHFSLTAARPLVPGVIELGGIHIKESKPLNNVSRIHYLYFTYVEGIEECTVKL